MLVDRVILKVVGLASEKLCRDIALLSGIAALEDRIVVFCDYSEYDVQSGYTFSYILDNKMNLLYNRSFRLEFISQQLLKPMEYIPKGWKTLCLFHFMDGEAPEVIYKLPLVEGWYQAEQFLYFSG